MKKLRFAMITVAALFAMQTVYGQAAVSLGLKGGLNFANVNTSSVGAAYDSRTGYHVGAFVGIKFAKFAIQPELIYSQQGSTVKINTSNFDANFSYMNIPVIFKFYIIGGFNLQAGPQFGFLMSATGPVDPTGTCSPTTTGDIKNQFSSSDISVGLGAGFDLPLKLSIDARYNLGVSDINSTAASSAVKNQVFQLSLGYKLFKFGN